MNAVFSIGALIAWGLTVVLVAYLLGGTFDTRACQTGCVQILYWSAFAVTGAGCAAGTWHHLKGRGSRLPVKVSLGAMWMLLVIFLATMVIGTFG